MDQDAATAKTNPNEPKEAKRSPKTSDTWLTAQGIRTATEKQETATQDHRIDKQPNLQPR